MSTRRILDADVVACTRDDAISAILSSMRKREKLKVGFANANLLVQLRRNNAVAIVNDFLLLNDGIAVDIGSQLLFGAPFPQNLNGTDFVGALLEALPATKRVFLFGGRPHVVEAAAREIESQFKLNVCGYIDGYRGPHDWSIDEIIAARPDVVLVALGNPKQEMWMHDNAALIDAELFIGVGAWFDFFTKATPRAPLWLRRVRLEWVHRLAQEPHRLWRRYSVDALFFFFLIVTELLQPRRRSLGRRRS